MKNLYITVFLSFFAIISYSQTVEKLKKDLAVSQSENQKLKDENKFLTDKLNFCTAISSDTITEIKSFSSLYSIKVISCIGNRNSQAVTIDLLLEHKSTHQSLAFNLKESKGINTMGQEFKLENPGLSTAYYSIMSDTPQRITFVINKVMPGTDMFSLVALKMGTSDLKEVSKTFSFTEIRNLKITW